MTRAQFLPRDGASRSRTRLRTLISTLLLTTFASSALAQDDGPRLDEDEDAAKLQDVTVTARRTEETLQDIPVAVSAFNPEDLRNYQAENLDSLNGVVPNLNLVQGRGSVSSANIFIRGIGQPDALQSFDPGVGVYVDDVYLSRIQGALLNLYDVERIEVLRGPQGTLYGKNTIGGAIKVVTKQPDEVSGGQIGLTLGNYGRIEGNAYASGALGDNVYASIAALYTQNDGFVKDQFTGREFNDDDTEALRFILKAEPSDELDLFFSADYTSQDTALTMGRLESILVAVDLADGSVVPLHFPEPGEFDYHAQTSFGPDQGQELDHWGMTFKADWRVNDAWTFKSITGYRQLDTDFFIDIDATEFELGDVRVVLDQDQFSQEFQFLFDNGGNFSGVTGFYYGKEDVPSEQAAFADDFLLAGGVPLTFLRTIEDDLETTSYAVFAHGNYILNDQWTLSGGLRYTKDEKDYFRTTSTFSNLPALEGTFAFNASDSWDAFTPSIALDYQADSGTLYYGSISRGFKSGGFNGRANTPADTSSFEPEFVWTYEMGAKASWLDNTLLTNWAVFYSDYSDFQARVAEDISSFPVINAAELEIYGLELESVYIISAETQLRASLGLLNSDYKEFFDFREPDQNRADDTPPFAPDITFSLAGLHNIYLSGGWAMTLGGDVRYVDDMFLSVDNQDVLTQDGYWLANAFTSVTSPDGDWTFTAGIRNITDEVYKVDAQEFSSVGNIQTAYYGDPQTFYVSALFRF